MRQRKRAFQGVAGVHMVSITMDLEFGTNFLSMGYYTQFVKEKEKKMTSSKYKTFSQ